MPSHSIAIDRFRQRIASAGWYAVARRSRNDGRLLWIVRCVRRDHTLHVRDTHQLRAWRSACDTVEAIASAQ